MKGWGTDMTDKITVTRPSMPELNEYISEISELWQTHWLTNMGTKHMQLQQKLQEFLGTEYVELFTNGHMALELTLQAMGLEGEVITTPFTFASTTHAIIRNGLEPVFCDISEEDYTIDASKIEDLITDKTCAILPVHVYGNVCDVEEIEQIADRFHLKVLYDAAHAFGVRYKDKGIGQFGDASCFSFHATKVFNTIEGGACCYRDSDFGRILYQLKNFGIRDEDTVEGVGANAKMNEFCAAMGLCNLRHVDEGRSRRKKIAERYWERLEGVDGLQLNNCKKDVYSNFAYFPILIDEKKFGSNRDKVKKMLADKNIFVRKYFYPLTNSFECFHGRYRVEDTPVAQEISQKVLTLPLYADLELKDVDWICDEIINCRQ